MFVLLNYDGCLLPWAMELDEQGEEVVLVNPKKGESSRSVGEGIVKVLTSIPEDPDAIYVVDSNAGEAGVTADRLWAMGAVVLGGGTKLWKLERDRAYGLQVAKKLGLSVPNTYEFKSPAEALKFLGSSEGKGEFVWKPERDVDARFTFVDPHREALIEFLQFLQAEYPGMPGILQEFVDGTQVSWSCWWNGEEITQWWVLLEDKKFRGRGIGPSTGCEISLVFPLIGREPAFVQGLDEFLRRNQMPPGEYDLSTMVTEDDVYFIEWGPRFGWDMDVVYLPIISLADTLHALALGVPTPEPENLFCLGVRLSVPPYPYLPKKGDQGAKELPIYLSEELSERADVFLYNARKKGNRLVVADEYGLIGVAVGVGGSLDEAVEALEEALEGVHVPELSWRPDYREYVEEVEDLVREIRGEAGEGARATSAETESRSSAAVPESKGGTGNSGGASEAD